MYNFTSAFAVCKCNVVRYVTGRDISVCRVFSSASVTGQKLCIYLLTSLSHVHAERNPWAACVLY